MKRKTPLRAKTPLRRKTPIRPRRSERKRQGKLAVVINPATIRQIREEAGGRCTRCGKQSRLEVHHVMERGMGGGRRVDERWNLIALCPACHRAYHDGQISRLEFITLIAQRDGLNFDDLLKRYLDYGVKVG